MIFLRLFHGSLYIIVVFTDPLLAYQACISKPSILTLRYVGSSPKKKLFFHGKPGKVNTTKRDFRDPTRFEENLVDPRMRILATRDLFSHV